TLYVLFMSSFFVALMSLNLTPYPTRRSSDLIRSNIMSANQQVLASPLLNGDMDLSQIDLKKIESQMVNVQAEMIKLAGLLIQNPEQKSDSTTEQENT